MIDYYKILEIPINAKEDEIKKAYYKMIKRWHPDVNLQDRNLSEIMARQINEAYETLRDPDNRNAYNIKLQSVRGFSSQNHYEKLRKNDEGKKKVVTPERESKSKDRDKMVRWASKFSRYIEVHPWSKKVYDNFSEEIKLNFISGNLSMEDILFMYGSLAIEKSNMGMKSNYFNSKTIRNMMQKHNSAEIAIRTISMMEVLLQMQIRLSQGLIQINGRSDSKWQVARKLLFLHKFLEKNPDKFFIGIKKFYITKEEWRWAVNSIH